MSTTRNIYVYKYDSRLRLTLSLSLSLSFGRTAAALLHLPTSHAHNTTQHNTTITAAYRLYSRTFFVSCHVVRQHEYEYGTSKNIPVDLYVLRTCSFVYTCIRTCIRVVARTGVDRGGEAQSDRGIHIQLRIFSYNLRTAFTLYSLKCVRSFHHCTGTCTYSK